MNYVQYVIPAVVLIGLLVWRLSAIRRRTFEKVADAVDTMRRAGLEQPRYVAVDGRDPRDAPARQQFAGMSRDLEANGFVLLGERMEERADRSIMGVVAWFRDETGTICGWCGVLRGGHQVMLMFSESASGDYFITNRGGADLRVAQPPTISHAHGPWDEGLIKQVRRHRALLAQKPGAQFTSVESAEEGTELLRHLREAVARWRAAQPPAVLLEGDLRRILREKYDDLGPGVIRVFAERGLT